MKFLVCIPALFFVLTNSEKASKKLSSPIKSVYTYRLTFQPDSTSKYLTQENMILSISDTISEFASSNKLKRDSIISNLKNDTQVNYTEGIDDKLATALQAPKTKFTFRIYKNTRDKTCLVHDNIGSYHISYLENHFPCNWKLEQTTSTIMGYKCQKATTNFGGRKYEAWFTREIPVSDGPYKFSGLPGLIVKIYDLRKSYDFELTGVRKPTRATFISMPTKSTFVSKEDFIKAVKAARINMLNGIGQNGTTYTFSEDVKQKIQENQKRKNNPIELQ
ncbi:MAG: GLPGLI family protein [Janthinobacterium lividum]